MQDAVVQRWHVTAESMARHAVLCMYRTQEASKIARARQIAQERLGRSLADRDEPQMVESVDANSPNKLGYKSKCDRQNLDDT